MTVPDPGRISSIYWIGAGVTATMLVIVAAAGVWLWTDRVRTIEAGERSVSALVRVLEEQTARSFEAVDLTLLGMIDAMRLNPSLPAHDARFEELMRQRLRLLPYVRALYVIGPDGFIKQDTDHQKTPHVSLRRPRLFPGSRQGSEPVPAHRPAPDQLLARDVVRQRKPAAGWPGRPVRRHRRRRG